MPKIYRVYIGQKLVRPKEEKVDYSYDFRNKTLAGVQADGWTFPSGTDGVAFDSNGMYKSASSYRWCMYNRGKPILANANKVTLTDHQNKGYYDIDCALGLECTEGSTNTTIARIAHGYGYSNFYLNGTNKWSSSSTLSNGYYTQIIEVDFTTSTIKFTCGSNVQSYSLSASDIAALRTVTGIFCATCKNQSNYIPDISIKVE